MIMKFILSILLILFGLKIVIVKKFYGRGGLVDFSSPFLHWPIGLFFILFGFYLLWIVFRDSKRK